MVEENEMGSLDRLTEGTVGSCENSHGLVDDPVGVVIDYPRVRGQRRAEEGVKVVEDIGVLDQTLDHLGQLAAANITVLAEELELFGEMFARPAPRLHPLLPRRYRRGLDHRGVSGRRPVDPPVGLLLTIRHDLVAALSVLVQLELLLRLHRDELPLGGEDLPQVVVGLDLVILQAVPLAVPLRPFGQVDGVLDVVWRVVLRRPVVGRLEPIQGTVVLHH